MSYEHFSPVKRGKIELMLKQGESNSAMARELGRHRTSVGREMVAAARALQVHLEGFQAQPAHGFDDRVNQVILRYPLGQVGRQQQRLISSDGNESCAHGWECV